MVVLHSDSGKRKKGSSAAKILGSGLAGVVELGLFHPVDTVAKRMMTNTSIKYFTPGMPMSTSLSNVSKVVFKDAYTKSFAQRGMSLFPGLGFAFGYKVLQRVYKFGGQPIATDAMERHAGRYFKSAFGDRYSKPMLHATTGSLIGIGEVLLLPLDVLKIKSQTNPAVLRGRGFFQIMREEKISGLYKGWKWTAARNAPGSFALFGGNAFVKEKVFKLERFGDATFFQNFIASTVGGLASLIVASPADVIKTRIQNRPFDSTETGFQIVKNLVKHEGLGAFFKGLTPKILVVGPKLVFSFTIAQSLISTFEDAFQATSVPKKVIDGSHPIISSEPAALAVKH